MTMNTPTHTTHLKALLSDMPTAPDSGDSAQHAYHRLMQAAQVIAGAAELPADDTNAPAALQKAKGALNDDTLAPNIPKSARPIFTAARLALIEQRAAHPRPGTGENPTYFAHLMNRETILIALLTTPQPSKEVTLARLNAAAAYHRLAGIARFAQNEPITATRARKELDAILAHPLTAHLPELDRMALQTAYEDSLF